MLLKLIVNKHFFVNSNFYWPNLGEAYRFGKAFEARFKYNGTVS